ncbi:hypothetical protein L3X38_013171 [Prunus dulcis]|uniref:Uncharacterized protein n=1 Tax=Prunus dulcis TaxID=3755 RepID=A0AAD4ZGS7_PRUDU|nr:hypothetical protein L3X38_013171 [Prunus dulcis]
MPKSDQPSNDNQYQIRAYRGARDNIGNILGTNGAPNHGPRFATGAGSRARRVDEVLLVRQFRPSKCRKLHEQLQQRTRFLAWFQSNRDQSWSSEGGTGPNSLNSEVPMTSKPVNSQKVSLLDEGGHVHIRHIIPSSLVDVGWYNPSPLGARRPHRHTRTTQQSGSYTELSHPGSAVA